MSAELTILEAILKRNSLAPGSIDISNEVNHYFYFDAISDPDDLDAAWSVFDERADIRRRLAHLERGAQTVRGWGYRTAPENVIVAADKELKVLVAEYIASIRPLIHEDEGNAEIVSFIDRGFLIEIATCDIEVPAAQANSLDIVLDEARTDYLIEHFPRDRPHYRVLYNWAIYLTKCDEVAFYLLWPCLWHKTSLSSETADAGFALWRLGCQNRYWIKDDNPESCTVYVRPPWADRP